MANFQTELQSNPYQPPSTVEASQYRSGIWNAIGRFCVLIYGVFYASLCISETSEKILSRVPIIETLFWIAMSVLTTYGILALAIRRLRIPQLGTFWQYFAVSLPFLTCLGVALKLSHDPPWSLIEWFIVLVMFAVLFTPALVFNWMVRHRLKDSTHRLR